MSNEDIPMKMNIKGHPYVNQKETFEISRANNEEISIIAGHIEDNWYKGMRCITYLTRLCK